MRHALARAAKDFADALIGIWVTPQGQGGRMYPRGDFGSQRGSQSR